jgi:ABC-type Na+ efflux pump permease subunit
MGLGPFLRRELTRSSRRRGTFWDRAMTATLVTALVAAVVVTWDWWEYDRLSVSGASRFALAMFGIVMGMQTLLVVGVVASEVSPGVALERDKKTLDALLTTELSSAEIVLGLLGVGLVKTAAIHLAALPVVVLIVVLGGVDPLWVPLAYAGIAATACAMGALAAAVSAGARTAQSSLALMMLMAMGWLMLPFMAVVVLPRLWPWGGRLVTPPALWLLDSSPLALVMNIVGVVRRTSLPHAVLRMIALELAGSLVLLAWAILRLRPASRALYDGEGRSALRRMLRKRWRDRPPCGDDPVLWHDVHTIPWAHPLAILAGRLILWGSIAVLVFMTSLFAVPAFAELFANGYGVQPGRGEPLELNPFVRMLLWKVGTYSVAADPGRARLEFNAALRQASGVFDFLFLLLLAGAASESIVAEKERDTWSGVIATPLSGREILRAKMLGAIWKARGFALVLLGLWTVGLLSGALHPLGYLAALASLAATTALFAASGTYVSLWAADRSQTGGPVLGVALLLSMSVVLLRLPHPFASVFNAAGSMPFLTWACLISYEDLHGMRTAGVLPAFSTAILDTGEGAAAVLAAFLIGLLGHAVAAALLFRAACRGFDATVGRPIPPGPRPRG